MKFSTPLTRLLNIDVPILSAGMARVAGPELVAAVSNVGGLGTLGAIGMSPEVLREQIRRTRTLLDPGRPMGVDLLLPKLGKGARATNRDYTGGQLEALIAVMIEEKIELFVCAVGVPPASVVDRLHEHGILVMNMVGSPRHVPKCIEAGVDIVCAQGTEAGGHTGELTTLVLLPQVVDLCAKHDILVVGAGGIGEGRGIVAALALGASGVWIGSRFIVTHEANAPQAMKQAILDSKSHETRRTEIYTGRPVRALNNAYIDEWEGERLVEKRELLASGRVPFHVEQREGRFDNRVPHPIPTEFSDVRNHSTEHFNSDLAAIPVGQICGTLTEEVSAAEVVRRLVAELGAALHALGNTR